MLTKFNDSNDMNTVASDAIHSYIKGGFHIDAKESMIDREKDKDCTFKAALKKDVDGIECKAIITLSETGKDDSNKVYTYHKVESVDDTKWSEETRTFSCSKKDALDLNSYANVVSQLADRDDRKVWDDDTWLESHHKRMKSISDKYGFNWDWLCDDECSDNESNADKKDTKWACKCPSAYQKLDDYIKLNTDNKDDGVKVKFTAPDGKEVEAVDLHDKEVRAEPAKDNHIEGDGTVHINVNKDDSVDDVYKKITDKRKDGLKEACGTKARKDWLASKDDPDEEDDLLKLVRLIFGR